MRPTLSSVKVDHIARIGAGLHMHEGKLIGRPIEVLSHYENIRLERMYQAWAHGKNLKSQSYRSSHELRPFITGLAIISREILRFCFDISPNLLSLLPHNDDYERTKIPTMTCTSLCDARPFCFCCGCCLWVESSLSERKVPQERRGVAAWGLKDGLPSGGWTCDHDKVVGETVGGMTIFVIQRH
jgi:hypothetical protein